MRWEMMMGMSARALPVRKPEMSQVARMYCVTSTRGDKSEGSEGWAVLGMTKSKIRLRVSPGWMGKPSLVLTKRAICAEEWVRLMAWAMISVRREILMSNTRLSVRFSMVSVKRLGSPRMPMSWARWPVRLITWSAERNGSLSSLP